MVSVITYTKAKIDQLIAGGVNGTTYPLTRTGSALKVNGVTKRFSGANLYWLGLDDNQGAAAPGAFPSHDQIRNAIRGTREMGANLIRGHTIGMSAGTTKSFETAPGTFSDANLDSADFAVYIAKTHGIYLMVPLTDQWNYYHGGKWNFVHWAYQQNSSGITDTPGTTKGDSNEDQFYANSTAGLRIRALFKAYISAWLNHVNPYTGLAYKDDPTIAIIETGNEIYSATAEWTNDIAQYIKSIAPNKLVADGSAASGLVVANSPGLNSTYIDIVGAHYYPQNGAPNYENVNFAQSPSRFGSTTSFLAQLASDVTSAVNASKAFIAGEYPWTRTDVASWYSNVEGNTNISADLFWSMIANDATGAPLTHGGALASDDYPVHRPYSGTNELSLAPALAKHIFKMTGIPA